MSTSLSMFGSGVVIGALVGVNTGESQDELSVKNLQMRENNDWRK